jgi:BolA protein
VLDESHMHSRGLQTHFKAVVVSAQFEGLNRVKRHQKVYATLGELMGEFHALALHTYTPQEWAEVGAARRRRPVPAVANTESSGACACAAPRIAFPGKLPQLRSFLLESATRRSAGAFF